MDYVYEVINHGQKPLVTTSWLDDTHTPFVSAASSHSRTCRQHSIKCDTVPGMTCVSDTRVRIAQEAANITHISFLAELQLVLLFYHLYFSVGRIALSVWRLTTGWTVRGSNPDEARFSAVQTGPGAHPAFCTMGNGSFPGVESGRGVTKTPHPLLVPWS